MKRILNGLRVLVGPIIIVVVCVLIAGVTCAIIELNSNLWHDGHYVLGTITTLLSIGLVAYLAGGND